jgi:regulator of RNase E activity RraA
MDIKKIELQLIEEYTKDRLENTLTKSFEGLTTSEISDGLGGNKLMDYGIKPIASGTRMIGRAFTVQLPYGESEITNNAIDLAEEGDVLVINTNNYYEKAVWGDVKAIKAMKKKIAGIVVDGSVRDMAKIVELGFPVFCRHIVMAASGKEGGGSFQVPVSCGGVKVSPSDIIIGDDNGVAVIPYHLMEPVLERAYKKLESDEEKIKNILLNKY